MLSIPKCSEETVPVYILVPIYKHGGKKPVQTTPQYFNSLKNNIMHHPIFNFVFISLPAFFKRLVSKSHNPLPNELGIEMWEYAEGVWVELR